jgi:hypothetical protein
MRRSNIVFLAVIMLAMIIAGCASPKASSEDRVPLTIDVDRDIYTPAMSSTVGIGLTPVYPSSTDNGTVSFRWQSDFGYFISWKAPDFKVITLRSDISADDQKIYWSYSPDDMGREKQPVRVTLTIIDKASGRTLNSTSLIITWKDLDTAIAGT